MPVESNLTLKHRSCTKKNYKGLTSSLGRKSNYTEMFDKFGMNQPIQVCWVRLQIMAAFSTQVENCFSKFWFHCINSLVFFSNVWKAIMGKELCKVEKLNVFMSSFCFQKFNFQKLRDKYTLHSSKTIIMFYQFFLKYLLISNKIVI